MFRGAVLALAIPVLLISTPARAQDSMPTSAPAAPGPASPESAPVGSEPAPAPDAVAPSHAQPEVEESGAETHEAQYDPGEDMRIDILPTNVPGLVELEILAEGGQVTGSLPGTYDPTLPVWWTVDDFGYTGTNAYRIRVISVDDPYCSAVTDIFSITR